MKVNNDYRVDYIFWNDVYKLDWYNHYKIWDSLNLPDSNLSIIADYNSNVYYKSYFSNPYNCFPVYIINETQNLNGFEFKDGYIYGIQEAVLLLFQLIPVGFTLLQLLFQEVAP